MCFELSFLFLDVRAVAHGQIERLLDPAGLFPGRMHHSALCHLERYLGALNSAFKAQSEKGKLSPFAVRGNQARITLLAPH